MIDRISRILAIAALGASFACDRGMAPFDPDEKPSPPDLARIFPEQTARRDDPAGEPGAAAMPADSAVAGSGDPRVRGEIRMLPALADRVPDDALLFVIARAEGGGPPLAVKRIENPALPLRFEIGPDDRMIAARPFVGPFTLSAWIDLDGNVMTRGAGDLEGSAGGTYQPGAERVEIVIDTAL